MSNYLQIKEELNKSGIELLVVSKMQEVDKIIDIYHQGQRKFAENRPQELKLKHENLPKDIEWHLIGHLQSNKVKLIVPFVHTIHSVDTFELAKIIHEQAVAIDRKINILLQIKLSIEETKHGFQFSSLLSSLQNEPWSTLNHLVICGVMGIGSLSNNMDICRLEFAQLKEHFEQLRKDYFSQNFNFNQISMGMSGDYKVAIEEGATIVRLGSIIFK